LSSIRTRADDGRAFAVLLRALHAGAVRRFRIKELHVISLRTAFVATLLAGAIAAGATAQAVAQAAPVPAFGSPPGGDYPILFNDRHVYSRPTKLKAGRVLGALVRGNTVLVPLRALFERLGAVVSYDAAT
jgi:hypothetical protein